MDVCVDVPWILVCKWFKKSPVAFSAVGVDSSSILGVNSTAAAVARLVVIDAMMGGDDDDNAAAGVAAPAAPARLPLRRRPKRIKPHAVVPAGEHNMYMPDGQPFHVLPVVMWRLGRSQVSMSLILASSW